MTRIVVVVEDEAAVVVQVTRSQNYYHTGNLGQSPLQGPIRRRQRVRK